MNLQNSKENNQGKIVKEMIRAANELGLEAKYLFAQYFTISNHSKKILWMESMPETTSASAYRITEHKYLTNKYLEINNFPVSKQEYFVNLNKASEFLQRYNKIVIKPSHGIHGKGITVGLTDEKKIPSAISLAEKFKNNKKIILEQFVEGDDYRILVIGKNKIFGSLRSPAKIVGDGSSTIKNLIQKNKKTGYYYPVEINDLTNQILDEQNLTLDSIPEKNKEVSLRKTANIKSGGESQDVTEKIPPKLRKTATDVAKLFNMDVLGIDISSKNLNKDFTIIELNAYPGLLLHIYPQKGKPHDVAKEILSYFFT